LDSALQGRQRGLEFMGDQAHEGFTLLFELFALGDITGNS
jgi:hypothetical protein